MKTKSTIFHRKLMIKTASLIVLSIIICACSTNNKSLLSGIEIIPVEVDEVSQDVSLFLEKIEIVPLETNDSSLFHRCNKVLYDKRTDMFVIYTSDQIIGEWAICCKFKEDERARTGRLRHGIGY